ncbi:MAG TPA: hypothetical protein VLL75_03890 [Vicinamibacteria bacterium]|nr:hypothetical protein [Vicinamibacteria bacterium]
MSTVTWPCPNCGRRVPNRVSQCHCGTTREDALRQAEAASAVVERSIRPRPRRTGPSLRWGALGRDIKALLVGIVVVTLLGLLSLLWPGRPQPLVPLLGHVDATPAPAPTPTPRPTPRPRSWLPWK